MWPFDAGKPKDQVEVEYLEAVTKYEAVKHDYIVSQGLGSWVPFGIGDSIQMAVARARINGFDDEKNSIQLSWVRANGGAYEGEYGLTADGVNEQGRLTAVNDMVALTDAVRAAFGTNNGKLDPDLGGKVFQSSEYRVDDAGNPVDVPGAPDLVKDLVKDADTVLPVPSLLNIGMGVLILGAVALYYAHRNGMLKVPTVKIGGA